MAIQREIQAKTVLTKSGISDYAVNCYVGCLHNCVYCYARYMRKFTNHVEPWGQFLDVKMNAADVLAKEVTKKKPGSIFFSSACDGWQPAEKKYELTRRCLKIAVDAGFRVSALTKSKLITRDMDILASSPESSLGCTITTLDETLRRRIEIAADPSVARVNVLQEAGEIGIKRWVFCGPLLPGLTDTSENLVPLFRKLAELGLDHVMVDKLNFRSGVLESVTAILHRFYPHLVPQYRLLYSSQQEYEAYAANLRLTVEEIAGATGVKCSVVF